jgi:hypothetical protein
MDDELEVIEKEVVVFYFRYYPAFAQRDRGSQWSFS